MSAACSLVSTDRRSQRRIGSGSSRGAGRGSKGHTGHGFTLFELIAVMAIVGVMLALAVPSYQYIGNANRIAAEVNGLLGDLQFARSEALKEGQPVSVCASSNGTSCTGGTAWAGGWIVFSDQNGNGALDSPPDFVIRAQNTFAGTDTLTASGGVAVITFNREGFASLAADALLTLHAATPTAASTRCLSVSLLGLMTIQTAGVGTCT